MPLASSSPLAAIEPRLRSLLPADLYAAAWVEPSLPTLMRVFEHLRTLRRILHDYMPRLVTEDPPTPGEIRHEWQEGSLMFTDLAGFTPLMEANSSRGRAGAISLLSVLNAYFAGMLEIISKSNGNLLEFTGDALLVQFAAEPRSNHTVQAVRAGLRMQRAMSRFAVIETPQGTLSLGMRIGIHTGRFLAADIGTPRRMEHVLLGETVQRTKHAEGSGAVGRVCLSLAAQERVRDQFRFEEGAPDHVLVVDDLADDELGDYDLSLRTSRRAASSIIMDRSIKGVVSEISESVKLAEPLASYLPMPVLNLLVESAARRQITPQFPELTVVFAKLIGLPEAVDHAGPEEERSIIANFSRIFALVNACIESRGGVLKNATCDKIGSDMMIYFGTPNAHTDDTRRAAYAALAIRDIILGCTPPTVGGRQLTLVCKIGISRGPAFAAEIGEPRGRREFNVLSDTVNTSARLMTRATDNQILINEAAQQELAELFDCAPLGAVALKGKTAAPLFELRGVLEAA